VRGALRECIALCHMSSSESFGIVLLEAWLAGRPVIANRHCAAFRDMAVHEENALLADETTLAQAIDRLLRDPALAAMLAANGRRVAERFDWSEVSAQFVAACVEVARPVL
jgi:glycosyltransferase involved in cell wall biosynthesis